ncbi:hypothetical protein ACFQE1_11540 [Halobium palmae]|uniref:Uncharacterized protein n=1 Tax=Halobium palmae TaxID=1776492 RepID=A0ABD5S190_9EURY
MHEDNRLLEEALEYATMSDRERSESGQFVETVSLEDVLAVFRRFEEPCITSADVADELSCTTEAARQKLARLREEGRVKSRKSGRITLWWLTEDSTEATGTPEGPLFSEGAVFKSDDTVDETAIDDTLYGEADG